MIGNEPPGYGISRQRVNQDDADVHVEEINYLGYTLLSSGLKPEVLAGLRDGIDRFYQKQTEACGGSAALGADSGILRCPLSHDDIFLEVARLPPVLEVARRVLGESMVLLQQNAIIIQPGSPHHQSRWHRDLPYQHFVSSRKLAVNALLCVDDFTFESGSTLVLPGSHMFEDFPSARLTARTERVLEAKAGYVIMMDAMLYHRAGVNISTRTRRAVNHLIGRPLLAQQIDIPRLLGPRFRNDPSLRGYLGYRWNPAEDVRAWRAAARE